VILARLRRARLLAGEDPYNPGHLDTHPLVREYFGEQLRSQRTDAWRECNRRLFHYYQTLAPQLYMALIGQWRYTFLTDKLTATMQIAERVYSLAQEQNDPAVVIGAYAALAATLFFLDDFETARQYAMHGVQIWRSGNVQSYAEEYLVPVVSCLLYGAMSEWYLGEMGFDFGQMVRHAHDNVLAEMLEKVLAYNISQIIRVRKKLSEREETERVAA
jgi:hypothetical protein